LVFGMGAEMRKALRTAVRGEWAKPESYDLQRELKFKGLELLEKDYEKCARTAVPIVDCYKRVADEKRLAEAYRAIWE